MSILRLLVGKWLLRRGHHPARKKCTHQSWLWLCVLSPINTASLPNLFWRKLSPWGPKELCLLLKTLTRFLLGDCCQTLRWRRKILTVFILLHTQIWHMQVPNLQSLDINVVPKRSKKPATFRVKPLTCNGACPTFLLEGWKKNTTQKEIHFCRITGNNLCSLVHFGHKPHDLSAQNLLGQCALKVSRDTQKVQPFQVMGLKGSLKVWLRI